jgi:hypothetical protein
MIRVRETFALSLTKLRTRKVRLLITVIISGLLFTALVGASMIGRGAFASINKFNKEGLGERFIIMGSNVKPNGNFFNDQGVLDRASELQKDLIARKKAEAKRLGIPYDPTSEPAAVEEYDSPSGKQKSIAMQTPIGKQAVQEYLAAHPDAGEPEFKQGAEPYGAASYYTSVQFPYLIDGRMQVLKDGKERFGMQQKNQSGPPSGLDSFPSNWSIMSAKLLEPFTLPGQNLKAGADGSIPIIVPYSAAEELAGLSKLPSSTPPEQKLARVKELRAKASTVTFTLCYRNTTSAGFIDSAIATQQEIDRNQKNKDYKKPDLIYGLPNEPCTAAPVVRDVRSKDQKQLEAKQQTFAEKFGTPAAAQRTFTFRVVGIVPDAIPQVATRADQILAPLVTSSLGIGWFSPIEETLKEPLFADAFNPLSLGLTGQRPSYYAEFKTAAQARSFLDKQSCSPDMSVYKNSNGGPADPFKKCEAAGKLFTLSSFGSNSLALEGVKRQFTKFFSIAALVVAAIGAVIMMGTVGRLITDSRRETAVFRALGAKRLDIAQIYLLYTAILSLLISIFAVAGGSLLAVLAQHHYGAGATVQALIAFNARDLSQIFGLYTFYLPDMLLLVGLALGIGLGSIAIPLIRNVRRNPIRDMRDDT